MPALEQLLKDVSDKKVLDSEEIRLKKRILHKEILGQLAAFGQSGQGFQFLLQPSKITEGQIRSAEKVISALKEHYNQEFIRKQAELDAVFSRAGNDQNGRNRLSKIREQTENKQINRRVEIEVISKGETVVNKN